MKIQMWSQYSLGFLVGVLVVMGFHQNNALPKLPKYLPVPPGVAYEFRDFTRDFLKAAHHAGAEDYIRPRLSYLTIKFGPVKNLDEGLSGWCEHQTNTIIVDQTTWKSMDAWGKQATIDHELGHCLLLRTHRNRIKLTVNGEDDDVNLNHKVLKQISNLSETPLHFENFQPQSIMYPVSFGDDHYRQHQQELRVELFDSRKFGKLPQLLTVLSQQEPMAKYLFQNPDTWVNTVENLLNEEPDPKSPDDYVASLIKPVETEEKSE